MRNSIALLLICALLAGGCATTPPAQQKANVTKPGNIKEWMALQSRAKKHAIAGALVGAVLGYASATITGRDPWESAAAGALAGALSGFAWGKREDRIFAGRDHAVRYAQYDSSQGYIARVEEVLFDPPQAKAGETATLYVRYLVIGPEPNESITVTMFRGLKYGEDYVFGAGPNEFVVPRGGGIVEAKVLVTLPKKAPAGTYGVEALLDDPQGRFRQVIGTSALYIVAS